jgi:hypothetical protein
MQIVGRVIGYALIDETPARMVYMPNAVYICEDRPMARRR